MPTDKDPIVDGTRRLVTKLKFHRRYTLQICAVHQSLWISLELPLLVLLLRENDGDDDDARLQLGSGARLQPSQQLHTQTDRKKVKEQNMERTVRGVTSATWPDFSFGGVPVVNCLGVDHMEEEVQVRVHVEVENEEQGIGETHGKEQSEWGDAHKHILEP